MNTLLTSALPSASPFRLAGLFCLFFLIALGLGYPILNRYDPRQTPGMSDVSGYAAVVTGGEVVGPSHLRFRVLVPWIAKPFYILLRGHIASWDPVMAGLLVADSLFVAATALLIAVLGMGLFGDESTALVAALLYFVNFAVPNLRLAGLVDAGEGFFLLALLWILSRNECRLLPVVAILGALTKEAFVPFSIVFTAAWWVSVRKAQQSAVPSAIWIVGSWLLGIVAVVGIHWKIDGSLVNPVNLAESFHRNRIYFQHFVSSVWDRNLAYIFVWLLPIGLPRLSKFPRAWLIPTATAAAMTFVLDGYYGAAPGTVGRELFSIAGPILTLSSASLLCNREPLQG